MLRRVIAVIQSKSSTMPVIKTLSLWQFSLNSILKRHRLTVLHLFTTIRHLCLIEKVKRPHNFDSVINNKRGAKRAYERLIEN